MSSRLALIATFAVAALAAAGDAGATSPPDDSAAPSTSESFTSDAGTVAQPENAIVTISGTATYRERIALPDGAVVTVQVNDVSLADAPAEVVAEAIITPTHQVPIPYAIAVLASSFEDGHRYSLSIGISLADELLFTTTEQLAVAPDSASQTMDVVLSAAGS